MEELYQLDNVSQYNANLGIETLHPLVSVIDMSKITKTRAYNRVKYGLYTMYLKDVKCGSIRYGRNTYDYQEGTLVFFAPEQIVTFEAPNPDVKPQGWALLFHPDLIRGTLLGRTIKEYSFFSYETHEALHLSEKEKQIVIDCLEKIDLELRHGIDKHSKTLIVANIELLLNYCVRFYDRQFITRGNVNKDVLMKFENVLDDYFQSENTQTLGLPSVRYCAEKLNLSANYLGDLIKKETGKSPQEHIQLKLIDIAKEKIFDTSKSVSQVAYELGFKYPQHFTRLFKQQVGFSPMEYRMKN